MGFHEVQFPPDISYGSKGGPGFKTEILTTDSGSEQRVAKWSTPRRFYDVSFGLKSWQDMKRVISFYIARLGAAYGFRYKDWLDYTSSTTGPVFSPVFTDQQIGVGDGVKTSFQLVKTYNDGFISRTRTITKPVNGTVTIGVGGVQQTSGWTVNSATGIVTFTSAPAYGMLISAGYEFDVPVRFDASSDQLISANLDDFDNSSIQSIGLIEIKDGLNQSDELFFGGLVISDMTASMSLSASDAKYQVLKPTVSGLILTLPDPTNLIEGGPYFFICNNAEIYSFTVKTNSGSTLIVLSPIDSVGFLIATINNVKSWILI